MTFRPLLCPWGVSKVGNSLATSSEKAKEKKKNIDQKDNIVVLSLTYNFAVFKKEKRLFLLGSKYFKDISVKIHFLTKLLYSNNVVSGNLTV